MSGRVGVEQTPDIERVLAKWTGCWCGEQQYPDHDPRVRDCPQHGSDDCRHMAEGIAHDLYGLAAAVREAEQRVASAFVEWAMKNESAEPPLDWAWFGEITRRYWPHHPEYRADRIAVDAPEGGEGR